MEQGPCEKLQGEKGKQKNQKKRSNETNQTKTAQGTERLPLATRRGGGITWSDHEQPEANMGFSSSELGVPTSCDHIFFFLSSDRPIVVELQ
jgi:hypothetical protein